MVANSVGTGYPAIPETRFGNIAMPVPPLAEQAAIVRYLDHADEIISRYVTVQGRGAKLVEPGLGIAGGDGDGYVI